MSKYDFELDLNTENSISLIINMIEANSRILEFGPANGRMTKYLSEKMGCVVDIVEIDEEAGKEASNYSKNSLVGTEDGDIEKFYWLNKLKNEKYDSIIFADVLEHLRDPKKVIEECGALLKENGTIVMSVPNIAHNSILLNLINDEFEYKNVGLLDDTHIKFFTYKSLKRMIDESGYISVIENATYCRVGENEIDNNYEMVNKDIARELRKRNNGNLYQFVFKIKRKGNNEKTELLKLKNTENEYNFQCYIMDEDCYEYTEEKSIRKEIQPEDEIIRVEVDFHEYDNINQIRIDPIETNCIIEINSIYMIKSNKKIDIEILDSNGSNVENNVYIFPYEDPQLYLNIKDKLINKLHIEYKILEYESSYIKSYGDLLVKLEKDKKIIIEEKDNVIEEKDNVIKEKNNVIKEKEEIIQEKINKIVKLDNVSVEKDNDIKRLNEELAKCKIGYNEQIRQLQQNLSYIQRMYDNISNSACWKLTKPLRVCLDVIKGFMKSHYYTNLVYKTLLYIKRYGIKETLQKVKSYTKTNKLEKNESKIYDNSYGENVLDFNEIEEIGRVNGTIAVHLHLYYIDLIDEFIGYLNNIPYKFDLFVSCKENSDIDNIKNRFSKIRNVQKVVVEITINRGRDIAPLYVQFGKRIEKYDYFLHIHSKKSLYSGTERYGWRQYSLDALLGSEHIVQSIFSLFESDRKIGLFFPEVYKDVPALGLTWLANEDLGRKVLGELGIPFEKGVFTYPVGSFFWARMEAVKPLFERGFTYDDFQEELGQNDGTIAHALERSIAFVCKHRGYEMAIHENVSKTIRFGRTLKPFNDYFSLDVYGARWILAQYDLVSFDIFDTLITRCIYEPDDVFKLMSRKIKIKYGMNVDFLSIRKEAEAIAWEKYHEYCSINNIYDELPKVMKISNEMALELKQMEIDTELDICVPRDDMLNVFNHVKENGKKIILISDMYLTTDIIEKMLKKCGYEGYDDLWVSCEKGARKDNGTLWDLFIEQYGQYNTIHSGDNERSDIQILGDKGRNTFHVFNPIMSFKLSRSYKKFEKYINTSIENSLMLGMLVNVGIYNSPFCLQVGSGEPFVDNSQKLGYASLGALCTGFINNINKKFSENSILLFLAREGYLFEKLYNVFCNSADIEPLKNEYFLTSRRAATVAAISSEEDVKDIISQYYDGGLTNMLKVRLGIDLYDNMQECRVKMPEDKVKIMNKLKPHMSSIIKKANDEAELYKQYISDIINENKEKEISVIDVGYSGTIQYYLSKLLNKKIPGYYICTDVNKKPEKLGCVCDAMYELQSVEERDVSKIFRGQLFLEAAFQAPYGQFICFEKKDGKSISQFKDDSEVPAEIKKLQAGIIEYCKQYSRIVKDIVNDIEMDKNLAEDIFYETFFDCNFSDDICNAFNVQDDYCSNGSHKFDRKSKQWKVN